jgi:hypothetical protein
MRMEFFTRLGTQIDDAWKQADYDEASFSEIAARGLEAMRPSDHVTMMDIIHWVHSTRTLVRETGYDGNFGQPPIVVFRAPHFFIEVLFWADATTAIHQHRFSGAFHVLSGSSIHTEYAFEESRRYNDRLLLGDLTTKSVEYLEKGSVRPIRPGAGMIHALFHLDNPSISVVVRNGTSAVSGPQHAYLSSGIAFDSAYSNEALYLRTRTLEILARSAHPEWKQLATAAVRDADSLGAFFFLRSLVGLLRSKEEYDAFLDDILPAHAELISHARSFHEADTRERNIIMRRGAIREKEHRLFLALLLNVSSRTEFLRLVEVVYPGESPVERVVGWTEQLSKETALDPLSGERESLIGLRLDETSLVVFRHLLNGATNDDVLRLLREEFDESDLEQQREDVLALCEAFRHSLLFERILRAPAQAPASNAQR